MFLKRKNDETDLPDHDEILKTIVPRVFQRSKHSDPVAALEVIDGPYKGVIFSYTSFQVAGDRLYNGMVPMKFDLTFFQVPKGFEQTEAFDRYAAEVVIAWFSYLQKTDIQGLYQMPTANTVQ